MKPIGNVRYGCQKTKFKRITFISILEKKLFHRKWVSLFKNVVFCKKLVF